MSKHNIKLFWIFLLILLISGILTVSGSCRFAKNTMDTIDRGLLIPVGRLALNNKVTLYIDNISTEYNLICDESGGYWAHIPFDRLTADSKVRLNIIKTNPDNTLYEEEIDTEFWTSPNYYFNSDNPTIKNKAEELTAGCTTDNEKVKKLHRFVLNEISWGLSPGMHYVQASRVLLRKSGICVGKSRLFIALCRTIGIPARSIQGAVFESGDNTFWHHEWIEFYNDDKEWQQLDPTSGGGFYLKDLRYFDLIYNFEGNSFHEFIKVWGKDGYKLEDGSVSVFISDRKLQESEGKMSFILINSNLPELIEVETVYDMSKYANLFE